MMIIYNSIGLILEPVIVIMLSALMLGFVATTFVIFTCIMLPIALVVVWTTSFITIFSSLAAFGINLTTILLALPFILMLLTFVWAFYKTLRDARVCAVPYLIANVIFSIAPAALRASSFDITTKAMVFNPAILVNEIFNITFVVVAFPLLLMFAITWSMNRHAATINKVRYERATAKTNRTKN